MLLSLPYHYDKHENSTDNYTEFHKQHSQILMFYEALNVKFEVSTVVTMKTCLMECDTIWSGRCFT